MGELVPGSEQVYVELGVDAVKSAGVGGESWPAALSGYVHDVAGEGVEHAGAGEQLVDLVRGVGVHLAKDDRGMAEQLCQLRSRVGSYGAYLGQRERRQVERDAHRSCGIEPGPSSEAAANKCRDER